MNPALVSLDELNAVLGTTRDRHTVKLPPLGLSDDLDELLDIAAEEDERGPLAAITGLLAGLRVRHSDNDTTLAVLAALEHYHLPALLDSAKG